MEPHKDMNGNILRLGDYVVKGGNEEVNFYYTGSNDQNDLIERTPFTGIVTVVDEQQYSREYHPDTGELVQSSGGDKVSAISISVLRPNRLQDYIVPVDEDDNSNIQLRRVGEMEGNRLDWRRYDTGQASGEGRRISRTGASTGQSGVEQGGRRKQRKKRTKKKSRKKKRKTFKKKRKRRKKKRKTRR